MKSFESVAKPLDFYLSCRSEHPAFPILKDLTDRFGNHFEKFEKFELNVLLAYCAVLPIRSSTVLRFTVEEKYSKDIKIATLLIKRLGVIDESWVLGLVPFLYAQMESRH